MPLLPKPLPPPKPLLVSLLPRPLPPAVPELTELVALDELGNMFSVLEVVAMMSS
jgi:hypothetical protein